MPSLELSSLFRPCDARWLGRYLPSRGPDTIHVLADEENCKKMGVSVTPGLDGRDVFDLLVTSPSGEKTRLTVNRQYIKTHKDDEVLTVEITPHGVLKTLHPTTQADIVGHARQCAIVDAVRLAGRRNEADLAYSIFVDFNHDGVPQPQWNIADQRHWGSAPFADDMQFSVVVFENSERVPSYPDVSVFDDRMWDLYGEYVSITRDEYERRVAGQIAESRFVHLA